MPQKKKKITKTLSETKHICQLMMILSANTNKCYDTVQ